MSGHRRLLRIASGALLGDSMTLLAALASDATLDAAFVWLCKRRRDYPDHADVWDFRRHWPAEKARLQSDLSSGRFRFGLLDRIAGGYGTSPGGSSQFTLTMPLAAFDRWDPMMDFMPPA